MFSALLPLPYIDIPRMPMKLAVPFSFIIDKSASVDTTSGDLYAFEFLIIFPQTLEAKVCSDENADALLMLSNHFADVELSCGELHCAEVGFQKSLHVNIFIVWTVICQEGR